MQNATNVNKLGFGDNKTVAPQSTEQLIGFLATLMSAAINNSVDLESAKVALNAATRIIDAQQADTRMKALAITSNRMLTKAGGWELIDVEPKQIETGA